MNTLGSAVAALLLLVSTGWADGDKPRYESRYAKWLPHVSNTLVVTVNTGGDAAAARGLLSGSFSAHLLPREPDAIRSNGTPLTAHAIVTAEEMMVVLKEIDGPRTVSGFSTCRDDDWREPGGEPTRLQVVWSSDKSGHTYDWYVLAKGDLLNFLQKVRATVQGKDALDVINGLVEGINSKGIPEKK
ncbi:MAG: hypothetical protein WCN95_08405 [bacterium]